MPNLRTVVIVAAVAIAAGCASLTSSPSVPARHPERLKAGRTDCLECHKDEASPALKDYGSFRHTAAFLAEHGLFAGQSQNLCASCHGTASCQECHPLRSGVLPGVGGGDRPDRPLPHGGDYIVRHGLDGRMNPASCLPCHGNRNTERCRSCHR